MTDQQGPSAAAAAAAAPASVCDLRKDYDAAMSELSSLGRVSHKLAMTDEGAPLERVLSLLLPRLLARVGSNHRRIADLVRTESKDIAIVVVAASTASTAVTTTVPDVKAVYDKIHAKLVEMLSHIMKRVRADSRCRIPCGAVLSLLYDDDARAARPAFATAAGVDPFTLNLSLTFLSLGVPRCDAAEVGALLPGLLALLGAHCGGKGGGGGGGGGRGGKKIESLRTAARKSQDHQCAHLVLRAIEAVVVGAGVAASSDGKKLASASASASTSTSNGSKDGQSTDASEVNKETPIESMRRMVCLDADAGAALYDLLLDALLYQPAAGIGGGGGGTASSGDSSSTLPCPGLSQAGYERLRAGPSLSSLNWAAEHSAQSRLRDLKLRLLDFIAPCRRFAAFLGGTRKPDGDGNDDDDDDKGRSSSSYSPAVIGVSRTVALLVASTADPNPDVSERASSYLKAHMDSIRNRTVSASADRSKSEAAPARSRSLLGPLGNPRLLATALLRLALGDTAADGVVVVAAAAAVSGNSDENVPGLLCRDSLGASIGIAPPGGDASSDDRLLFLSARRRMLTGEMSAVVLSFVSGRIFDDIPDIFAGKKSIDDASLLGRLVLAYCNNHLTGNPDSAGSRKSPQVAASRLLCSFCIRLAALYDAISSPSRNDDATIVRDILARALAIACSVLSSSSNLYTPQPGRINVIETKDACYGVVCSLARSNFAKGDDGLIFNCGGVGSMANASSDAQGGVQSIATAALLFACASNEEETLRPRSVAALDALLAAYCRVVENAERTRVEALNVGDNPWQQPSSVVGSLISGSTPDNEATSVFRSLGKSLLPLLWGAAKTSQPKAARLAAARWASDLLKRLDLTCACHILCFLSGDVDVTTSSIARDGLGIGLIDADDEDMVKSNNAASHPDFGSLADALFPKGKGAGTSWRPNYYDFSIRGQSTALRFGMICLLSDLYGEDAKLEEYIMAISSSLLELSSGNSSKGKEWTDLLDECSICLRTCLAHSHMARRLVTQESSPMSCAFIGQLALSADSSRARRHFAASCGHLYDDFSLWCTQATNAELINWAEKSGLKDNLKISCGKLKGMESNLYMAGEVHGAAFLGASCVRSLRSASTGSFAACDGCESSASLWESAASIVAALGKGASHSDESIGTACSRGLAISLSYDGVDAPILQEALYPAVSIALDELRASIRRYGNGDHTDATRVSSLARTAGIVLAASTAGAGHVGNDMSGSTVALGEVRLRCVDALFALLGSSAFRKDPEISVVAGEALASYADAYSPTGAVWTLPTKPKPESFDEEYAKELPPHKHVIYVLLEKELNANSPHKRNSCGPAMLALVGRAAKTLNDNITNQNRAFVQEILKNLLEFQNAFISLLKYPKSKQLGRESCCLGLAGCRGLTEKIKPSDGDSAQMAQEVNERLLRAFGQTTNFGGSAMMETRRQRTERQQQNMRGSGEPSATVLMEEFGEDTEVGGASGVGEAALGAYREMAAAAVSLGRPDILYSLMLLSATHPVWHSQGYRDRYNAASLIGRLAAGGVNVEGIRKALRPHLRRLIPRLLRACNDPNKQTRDQMNGLWTTLTGGGAESRSLISEHFLPTFDALMQDATSKFWRARAGACGALSEIIVGRTWEELGGGDAAMDDSEILDDSGNHASTGVRLLRLWRVTSRALDDVRLTVRESGEVLARSVRSLTVRLCDPSAIEQSSSTYDLSADDTEMTAAAAAATALRWLVKFGLNQPCAEAVGICVSSLLGIVEVARPSTLQPVLPELIGSLAMAMSGLEPSALNYLQVRAAGEDNGPNLGGVSGYDQLERLRLQLVQSGPIASALTKCLGMLQFVSVQSQQAVIPEIDSALRCGAGFATRAAAADAVTTLCATCPLAFKFPGHSNANQTVRLLRALYFASERERGNAAKDKMAHALGSLAALSPGHSVRVLALRACERYSSATGSSDDPAARRAAAAALRAIAVRASAQFGDGGSNDIWCRKVLPLAFLGRKDKDTKVAGLWKDVWDEGGTVASVSSNNAKESGVSLEEKLLPYLVQECVSSMNDVSWTKREIACSALAELAESEILAPLSRPLDPSRDVNLSTSALLRSRRRAQAANHALTNCVKLIVKSRVWTGKTQLVKATVLIAGKWVNAGTAQGCNDWINLGWEDTPKRCPWMPIFQGLTWEDLFVGDGWFDINVEAHEERTESEIQNNQNQDEQPKETEDTALDFSEGDKMFVEPADPCEPGVIESSECVTDHLTVTLSGLCRALLDQAFPSMARLTSLDIDELLPFRAAALQGLAQLRQSISEASELECKEQTKFLFRMLSPRLIDVLQSCGAGSNPELPPLIIARSIECLAAAMWYGIGQEQDKVDTEDLARLANLFCELCGPKQPAWTVREASAFAGANLASRADLCPLRRHKTISTLLGCTSHTTKDRKFWRVRYAGLRLLHALVMRVGSSAERYVTASTAPRKADPGRHLLLEAILPHKENILKLAKTGLSDNESKVTAVASEICCNISWWP